MDIAIVLGLLSIALILFITEKLPVDIVTIILIVTLVLTGILSPEEAYKGFSSDFIVILASIFVVSGAIQETGILGIFASWLSKIAKGNQTVVLLLIMIIPGAISAFMNNTTVTALFLGPIMALASQTGISSSKLLMPLSFASILGGTCTLIGTSTNIAVSGYMEHAGLTPVGMFELLPVGLIIFAVGIAYMVLVGKHMLPDNKSNIEQSFGLRSYLTEIIVKPNSALIEQPVFESDLKKMGFRIINVIRNETQIYPHSRTKILEGDMLLVQGKIEELMLAKDTKGIDIRADMILEKDAPGELQLAEVLVTPQSRLARHRLRDLRLDSNYGVVVVAINRMGQTLSDQLHNIIMHVGDVLLVQGTPTQLEDLQATYNTLQLNSFKPVARKKLRGFLAIGAVLAGSFGLMPLSIAFLGAAVITVIIGIIESERTYELIDWRLLILIGGMTAFGTAMEKSGASLWLADGIVNLMSPLGITAIITGFVILTILLTQPMSNAAAALVVLPIALETAQQLDVNPRTFGIAIMLAASISVITPFEPSLLLVYGPGKYKFSDFIKIGGLLTVISVILIVFLVPKYWPL
ncbi:MAG: SLC13 family permease [Bacteroidota bacterium]|nr:SLC13 family permease [Bacteroidota bacterium]